MDNTQINFQNLGGYSRVSNDALRWQDKIAQERATAIYNISIKGISSCFECQENDIRYDDVHDEVWCEKCGLVLRTAFKDYTPYNNIDVAEPEEISREMNMKNYAEDLKEALGIKSKSIKDLIESTYIRRDK